MANDHLGLDLNGQWHTFDTSDVTWSQKSTLVYILSPEFMPINDVQMYYCTDLPKSQFI